MDSAAIRRWWHKRRRRPLVFNRCTAVSPTGKRCKYRRGHDTTGEPHSWTLFEFGGLRG